MLRPELPATKSFRPGLFRFSNSVTECPALEITSAAMSAAGPEPTMATLLMNGRIHPMKTRIHVFVQECR